MGFIERFLRDVQIRTQKAADISRQALEVGEARLQREAVGRIIQEQRRRMAVAFATENNVGDVLSKFAGLLTRKLKLDQGFGYAEYFPGSTTAPGSIIRRGYPDSNLDSVVWHVKNIGDEGGITYSGFTYIAAETLPTGDVQFHSSKKIDLIPLGRWRENRDVFDNALERAYDSPAIWKPPVQIGGHVVGPGNR